MAEERGYERRVATGGPAPAVLANPDDYGAGIGRALSQAGGQLHEQKLRRYRIERQEAADSETAAAEVNAAAMRLEFDREWEERTKGPQGGEGLSKWAEDMLSAQGERLVQGITEDSVRRRVMGRFADFASRKAAEAFAYEKGWQLKRNVDHVEQARDLSINRITTKGGDAETTTEELASRVSQIKELGLPPEIEEPLLKETEGLLQEAHMRALGKENPEEVKAAIAAGRLDEVLSPDDRERLDREMDHNIKARQYEVELAAKEARDAAAADLDTLAARQERGETIGVRDIGAAAARARAAGVPEADVVRWETAREDGVALRPFNLINDPTGARSFAEAGRIEAKAARGEQLTPLEERSYDVLRAQGEKRAKDQGAALKGLSDEELVERVQLLPPEQRAATIDGARASGILADVAMLPTAKLRAAAIEGGRLVKDRPELLKDRIGQNTADAEFEANVGVLGRRLGKQYGPKREIAKALYANWAARSGHTEFDKAAFSKYVSVAFGATLRDDGEMQGGLGKVNGRTVLLPDEFTAADLRRAIARTDWSDGRYRNGKPVSKAFIVDEMHPEWVGETPDRMIYHMVDRYGNVLTGPDEKTPLPFRVDKRRRR